MISSLLWIGTSMRENATKAAPFFFMSQNLVTHQPKAASQYLDLI
jgi:hypothetical protein